MLQLLQNQQHHLHQDQLHLQDQRHLHQDQLLLNNQTEQLQFLQDHKDIDMSNIIAILVIVHHCCIINIKYHNWTSTYSIVAL